MVNILTVDAAITTEHIGVTAPCYIVLTITHTITPPIARSIIPKIHVITLIERGSTKEIPFPRYQRAVAHLGLLTIIPPYDDGLGAGTVMTLSQTIVLDG